MRGMHAFWVAVVATAGAMVGPGCQAGGVADGPTAQGPVTYWRDVKPILEARCEGCHGAGGVAPFALDTYELASAQAAAIVAATKSKNMPPWGAHDTADCKPTRPWKEDLRLSEAELAILERWRDQGAQAGDPATRPASRRQAPATLQNADVELAGQQPFTLTETKKDTFQCVVLDPGLTETRWVNGVEFVPGNAAIVHHAVLYIDPTGESRSKMGPDGTYPCFGSAGVKDQALLGAWAPGARPNEYPANVGLPLGKGSLIVAQLHYHPSADPKVQSTPDASKLRIRWTKAKPEWNVTFALVGNYDKPVENGIGLYKDPSDPNALSEFVIPAGARDKTVTMRTTIPPDLKTGSIPRLYLYGIGAHMHYVGTKAQITVRRLTPKDPEPQDECLLSIPRWDFNWQRGYEYDVPIESLPTLSQFDVLDIKCTYDNSMQNPKVVAALREQNLTAPRDVSLGEETLDEMCLGVYQVLTKAQ